MTKPDPNQPVVVGDFATELEASFIVSALDVAGVPAWVTGQITAGFRAEAPGRVRVLVRASDAEKAREALIEHEKDLSEDEPDERDG